MGKLNNFIKLNELKKLPDVKIFMSCQEAKKFCKYIYFDYVKTLDSAAIRSIMSIQSHGLTIDWDRECIDIIRNSIDNFPEVPYDIIIYRAGNMKEKNRPFLSATFLESIGYKFSCGNSKKLHKIVVKRGAKIIPLFPINQLFGIEDPEMEVIIDTSKLKKCWGYYYYK